METYTESIQRRLAALEQRIEELRRDSRRGALLRALTNQWGDSREAVRRAVLLATYAASSDDYETAAGVLRALDLPEGDVWELLQPMIEASADFPDEVFAGLYEPAGMEE